MKKKWLLKATTASFMILGTMSAFNIAQAMERDDEPKILGTQAKVSSPFDAAKRFFNAGMAYFKLPETIFSLTASSATSLDAEPEIFDIPIKPSEPSSSTEVSSNPFDLIPDEMVAEILKHTSVELTRMTCKRFNKIVEGPEFSLSANPQQLIEQLKAYLPQDGSRIPFRKLTPLIFKTFNAADLLFNAGMAYFKLPDAITSPEMGASLLSEPTGSLKVIALFHRWRPYGLAFTLARILGHNEATQCMDHIYTAYEESFKQWQDHVFLHFFPIKDLPDMSSSFPPDLLKAFFLQEDIANFSRIWGRNEAYKETLIHISSYNTIIEKLRAVDVPKGIRKWFEVFDRFTSFIGVFKKRNTSREGYVAKVKKAKHLYTPQEINKRFDVFNRLTSFLKNSSLQEKWKNQELLSLYDHHTQQLEDELKNLCGVKELGKLLFSDNLEEVTTLFKKELENKCFDAARLYSAAARDSVIPSEKVALLLKLAQFYEKGGANHLAENVYSDAAQASVIPSEKAALYFKIAQLYEGSGFNILTAVPYAIASFYSPDESDKKLFKDKAIACAHAAKEAPSFKEAWNNYINYYKNEPELYKALSEFSTFFP